MTASATEDIKKRILSVLTDGPVRTKEIIEGLGFDAGQSLMDQMTRLPGFAPLTGSFVGSDEQHVLGNLVASGDVVWQRAANMDNWYALPGQQFPPEASQRHQTLRQFVDAVLKRLPSDVQKALNLSNIAKIGKDDVWVYMHPFTLSLGDDGGWELADGDPVCNWCFNTFTDEFTVDTTPDAVAHQIGRRLKDHNRQKQDREDRRKVENRYWNAVIKRVLAHPLLKNVRSVHQREYRFCNFFMDDRSIGMVRLGLVGEFSDLYLRGVIPWEDGEFHPIQSDGTIRKRWVKSEMQPGEIAAAIAGALSIRTSKH